MIESWPEVPLNELCVSIVDCVNKTAPVVDYPTPYKMIRTTNVRAGRVDTETVRYVTEETYRIWIRREVPQPGDVILTREAPLGEVGMLRDATGIFLGQRLMSYRTDPARLDPHFLLFAFQERHLQGQIRAAGAGATVEHIRVPDAEQLSICLPPLPIQHKIAGVLSAYDDLFENNARRIALLEGMAQALYREWFVELRFPGCELAEFVKDEQGRRPRAWEQIPFTLMASVLSGGTPKTGEARYWDGGIPFYTPKDSPDGFYVTGTEKTLTGLGLEKCNSQLYPKDTVFITARGTVGKLALASEDMAMNQSCYALVGRRGIPQHYLFLLTQILVAGFKQQANGAVFDAITVASFENTKVLRPPDELLASFSTAVGPLFAASLSLTQRNANLRRTRDLLLPRLISGELDVSNLDIRLSGSSTSFPYVSEDDQFEQAPS